MVVSNTRAIVAIRDGIVLIIVPSLMLTNTFWESGEVTTFPAKEQTMRYLAVLYPATEGGYAVEFPDFPEALTQGDTLDEAIDMATNALGIVVEEYVKARKNIPEPSTLEQVKAVAAHEMATAHGIDHDREPVFQLIPAPDI